MYLMVWLSQPGHSHARKDSVMLPSLFLGPLRNCKGSLSQQQLHCHCHDCLLWYSVHVDSREKDVPVWAVTLQVSCRSMSVGTAASLHHIMLQGGIILGSCLMLILPDADSGDAIIGSAQTVPDFINLRPNDPCHQPPTLPPAQCKSWSAGSGNQSAPHKLCQVASFTFC